MKNTKSTLYHICAGVFELCFIAWFYVTNKQQYKIAKATRELRMLCYSFSLAIENNGDKLAQTHEQLNQMTQDSERLKLIVATAVSNITQEIKADFIRRNTLPSGSDVLHRLSKEQRGYLAELNMLTVKLAEKTTKLNRLNDLECRLVEVYEAAQSHYELVDLAMHVGGLVEFISQTKFEGMQCLLEKLTDDVEQLNGTSLHIRREVEVEKGEFDLALKPIDTNKAASGGILSLINVFMPQGEDKKKNLTV